VAAAVLEQEADTTAEAVVEEVAAGAAPAATISRDRMVKEAAKAEGSAAAGDTIAMPADTRLAIAINLAAI
jgi:hypothetical protein